MLKYLPLLLVLLCVGARGQSRITLVEKGDSSMYWVPVNDTLSYISFTDPENINKKLMESMGNFTAEPIRSYWVLAHRFEKDTFFLKEVFGKRYLNASVEYSTREEYPKGRFVILFEGKNVTDEKFLNTFDSLFVQIGDSVYLGDLNTTIFRFETQPPPQGKFDVRVYDSQGKVDYTVPVHGKKYVTGLFIRFDLLESSLHSFGVQTYLSQHIPDAVKMDAGTRALKIQWIDWPYYWQAHKIRYSNATLQHHGK